MIRPQLVGVDTHKISAALATVTDIQKVMSTLLYKKLSPNVYIKLRATLRIFFDSAFLCKELTRLGLSDEHFTQVQHLYNHLQQLLKDDNDFQEDMNFIRDGYHADIDELRKVAYHSDELLMHYQQELSLRSGINTVKLKYVMNQ
jgi:DNA mismatch repair protein MutS